MNASSTTSDVSEWNEFGSTTIVRPDFVPFDEERAVRIYRRNLPHWRQDGATYFVTFRLGDSVPRAVLRQWEYEKQKWLSARGITCNGKDDWKCQLQKLSDRDQYLFHEHFNRLFHVALDEGRGECHLNCPACIMEVRNKLFELDGDAYHLGDFVIMPNHVHALLLPNPGHELEMVMKSIKGASARSCNKALERTGTFWQPDSYDHIVRDLEQLVQFRGYIADNPRKAGITIAPEAIYHADWMDRWLSS